MLKRKHGLIAAAQLLVLALIVTVAAPGRAEAAPYQVVLSGSMAAGTAGLSLTFTVPKVAGNPRFHILYASGNCFAPTGQICVLSVLTEVNGVTVGTPFNLGTSNVGTYSGGDSLWRAGTNVNLWADSGTTVTLRSDRNLTTGAASVTMSVSGTLE